MMLLIQQLRAEVHPDSRRPQVLLDDGKQLQQKGLHVGGVNGIAQQSRQGGILRPLQSEHRVSKVVSHKFSEL